MPTGSMWKHPGVWLSRASISSGFKHIRPEAE
jgi:hypothetical protein